MTTQITPFAFGDNMVRVRMDENGTPWFVAKDVATILEIQNIRQNMDGLDEDEKGVSTVYTPSGEQQMATVSESGLYALIFRSRKPEAKAFRKWVTSEVLPTLRKTGRFAMPGASPEQSLPQGLSSEAIRYLQEFSGSRIALTGRVLSLAESMGVKNGQTVRALFDLYARTFLGTDDPRPATVLPKEIEKKIWKDIEALTAAKSGWDICRRAHAFVALCALVEELRPRRNQSRILRAELVGYICANLE